MPIDVSQENLLQITALCAVFVACLRLMAALVKTAFRAALRFRLACLALSISVELGRFRLCDRIGEEMPEEKDRVVG